MVPLTRRRRNDTMAQCVDTRFDPMTVPDKRNDMEAQYSSSQADRCNWNRQRISRCGNHNNTKRNTPPQVHKPSTESLSSPLEAYTGDPLLDSLRDRLSSTKRQADNEDTIISVIDELTTYIRRRSYIHRGVRKRRHGGSDVDANRKHYQSNIRSGNKSRKLSASTHSTSEYPENVSTGAITTTDNIIGISDDDIYVASSVGNLTDSDDIVRDSSRIADGFDFNEKRTACLGNVVFQTNAHHARSNADVASEHTLIPISSTLNANSEVEDLSKHLTAIPPDVGCMGNFVHGGKVERFKRTGESLHSYNSPLSSCSLHDDIWLQFDDTINETAITEQPPSVNCAGNRDSFISDNSDMRTTMRGNSDFRHAIPKNQTRKRCLEIDSVLSASNENEDLCFREIVGDYDECASAGLSFCDVNANCSIGSSIVDEFVHLSEKAFAFAAMHSSSYDEKGFGAHENLKCENFVADRLSQTDQVSTCMECSETDNVCMDKSDVIRQAYFGNEDVLELFQHNTPYLSSQIETATNCFSSLDEQAGPVKTSESPSEHDMTEWEAISGSATNNDVNVSSNTSCCAFIFKSNTIHNVLHNSVSNSGTTDVTCDERCIVESWDANIEYICDSNRITDFYRPYQELSQPQTPNTRRTSNNALKSSGCDLIDGATNDFVSTTNLSDSESASDCSMLSSLSDAEPIIAHGPRICKTSASQYTQTGFDCILGHDNTIVAFRPDCSYGERYGDHLATNSSDQPSACNEVVRADPASNDDCDISVNDVSAAIQHHTCQMPQDVWCSDDEVDECDYIADKNVNEALDLLLSIMEAN